MPKKPIAPEMIEPSIDDPQKAGCFAMYVAGWGPAEIEKRTGIRADKIRQWCHRDGWVEQKKSIENFKREKNPITEQPLVKAVKNARKGELRQEFVENMGEIAVEDSRYWKKLPPDERLAAAPAIVGLAGLGRKTFDLDNPEESTEKGAISLHFLTNSHEDGYVKILGSEKVKEIEDAPPEKVYTIDDF